MPSNHLILCRPLLLFASGCQSIGVSASASVLPMVIQDWFVESPCGPRDSQESSPTSQFKSMSSSVLSFLYGLTVASYLTTGKTIALTRWTFVGKVMSLLLNMLSRLVITFLPRNKRLLISWLQSLSAVILEPKKTKFDTVSIFSLLIYHEVMEPDAMIFLFWMLSFSQLFHSPLSLSSRGSLALQGSMNT